VVREWIRELNADRATELARSALTLDSADEVARAANSMRNVVPALSA
jgi:hypothetical protein